MRGLQRTESDGREPSLLVFPNFLLTSALAKKQLWEESKESLGGNSVQGVAFDAFTEM